MALDMTSDDEVDVEVWRHGVGPPALYDVMAGTQFALLHALGLREHHTVADVGCGSLRAGRLLVTYLGAWNYYGIEPLERRLQAGIAQHLGDHLVAAKQPSFAVGDDFPLERFGVRFDIVLAQSIFSHTFEDLARLGFGKIAGALKPDGMLVGTFVERVPLLPPGIRARAPRSASGWFGNGSVPYTWREIRALMAEAGLDAQRLHWWHHRQSWFVASLPQGAAARRRRVRGVRHRLRGAPTALRVAPGITARLGLARVLRP
jgi:SAM-dependent methyltransferase